MRLSGYFLPTLREDPAEAEVVSHRLMLRAGMIRKLASGIYSYLPYGLAALRNVETIIREEMNRAGAQEVLLPMVQPAELWQETGRWEKYGRELLRFKDRKEHDFCLAPTAEEVITDLVRREVRSYRQLPLTLYQIQTKFRDEIRPRFGLMRGREFIMKDAYSFDADEAGAEASYEAMYEAYQRIFKRCGLKFRAVAADTGAIGGHASHEFMVLADTGEDLIAVCSRCDYAANIELAEAIATPHAPKGKKAPLEKVHTPGAHRAEEVAEFLGKTPQEIVKTLIYLADGRPVAVLIRGDHELNEVKLKKALKAEVLEMAPVEVVEKVTKAPVGFAGPVGLEIEMIADKAIAGLKNFVTGANEADFHYLNVNLGRDFPTPTFADLRNVVPGDPCPQCGEGLEIIRGIEVGHIFKLGTQYSQAMGATFLDAQGRQRPLIMGCYGIGVGRTVAAAIEQNHDENGIIFPVPIAPFKVIVVPVNIKDDQISKTAQNLYQELQNSVPTLLDDRDERPGVKFKDADLIGVPLRVTIGKKLKEGLVEIKKRATGETQLVSVSEAASRIRTLLNEETPSV
ncbi:proline--tRNA ligase [Thermosulfuriphilus sp.]